MTDSGKETGKRVLAIDDEVVTRRVVARLLETNGYRVSLACSAEEALEVLERERPAVVICDLVMPGMGGVAFVELVRARADLAGLPILILSGRGSKSDRERALAAGADQYMNKPFSSIDLLASVQRLVDSTDLRAA
ncbi:MAG: response regulator [Candidatus Eisenbacteria bacterium]|uniref:Response regulator n=1 Tax=Eiseniibacteriota bacterium TaxID=2212470 RepID=A0A956RQA2_UNCEI|nr:response regulator [Candidatus Eisenbacteria bacterium]